MSDYISGLRPSDLRKGDVILISHAGQLFDVERETRVPPLPTAPYTVIRVTDTGEIWCLDGAHNWRDTLDGEIVQFIHIAGFEVLSEPRAITAKTVLDRVRDYNEGSAAWIVKRIAPEFGVTDE